MEALRKSTRLTFDLQISNGQNWVDKIMKIVFERAILTEYGNPLLQELFLKHRQMMEEWKIFHLDQRAADRQNAVVYLP